MIKIIINIDSKIVKHFNYLYKYFPSEVVPKIIEQDLNTMFLSIIDDKEYIDKIQKNDSGWVLVNKIIS